MAAITWRTVMSQSLAEASRPLEAASKSITGAFDRFGSVISDYEAGQQKIVDRGDEAKVLAFREALAAAKSKEAVAAIEQGRDQALSGVAPKFRAPTVGAEDARLSAIYKNTVEARAADDSNMEFQHRATVEKAKALSAAGDVNGANALIATLPENFLGRGTLAAGAVTGDRATQTFKDSLLTTKSQRDVAATGAINQTTTAAAATLDAATNSLRAQTQAEQVRLQTQERAAAGRMAAAEKLAAADKTTIGSTEGFNAVMDRVSKIVDKQHLGKITAFTAEALASNPEFRKLPVDVVETIILRRANNIKDTINPFSWIANWGSASDIANDLKGALAEPAIQKRILEGELSRQVLRTRLTAPPPSLNGAQGPALVDAAVARAPGQGQSPGPETDLARLTRAVMGSESGGQRYGKDGKLLESPKGAKGEMQVMDPTNMAPGYGVVPAKDNSPDERARVGRDYLAAMVKNYNGNMPQAVAAYNAGPGAVDAAIKAGGADWLSKLPKETQDYVPKVLETAGMGGNAPVSVVPVVYKPPAADTAAADRLRRQAELERDEIALNPRKKFTAEAQAYWDKQNADKSAVAKAKAEEADRADKLDQATRKAELQARAEQSRYDALPPAEKQKRDLIRRREELERELAAAKKAK